MGDAFVTGVMKKSPAKAGLRGQEVRRLRNFNHSGAICRPRYFAGATFAIMPSNGL
jgi:hypothetical protein